jgi:uncharacterized protein
MNVLITGGTGLVGSRLTELLLQQGFTVSHLSRKPTNTTGEVKSFHWDVSKGIIDEQALLEADYLIHLAGAGIADKHWTDARKKELIESRTETIALITNKLQNTPHKIKAFVSASGIGFYGADTGNERVSEQYKVGDDFLAECCVAWENAADKIESLGIRTTKLRIGIILSEKGGALPKLLMPVRFWIGSPIGTGRQFQSWIHIDDVCGLFMKSLTDTNMSGVYNTVASTPVTNAELTKIAAQVLKKPLFFPNVPAFILKILFGEMANIILGGNYVLNERIQKETDFQYKFPDLKAALGDLLR